ncbi:carbon-nitrogen hydrolase family protein [Caballeronia sp. BR00000012568055]|uniref:carbon-nitrogen hydrolase family protein n=1 Tax=Caballeronia sp. BR00000012568055 TaxID=2918761 RepID=UPI0023F7498B|nr:carbon-nitrogen hydrolase family protein [Caballeronia sp. BR00000012568055]
MSNERFIVGCVQTTPTDDLRANIDQVSRSIEIAAQRGATLVATPEYSFFLHASGRSMRDSAAREEDHPALPQFVSIARKHRIWLILGSLVIRTDEGNIVNRSIVISDQGEIVARYDKIHMFDATLPSGRTIRESSSYTPGTRAVLVNTPWGRLGITVCYDLRFPALYRALAQSGAQILLVPSAFTRATGSLHWHTLLKARAIENRAFVVAPATCGTHPGGHETYGHSLIVDPDGREVAAAGEAPDVICAEIDLDVVSVARARMPSLTHDRAFETSHISANSIETKHEQI